MSHFALRPRFLAALLAAGLGLIQPAAAEELKLLLAWSQDNEANWRTAQALADKLAERSQGRLTLRIFDPTVVPAMKQLQPVSAGAFDLNYTSPGYHADATSIGSLGDTVVPDPEKRRSTGLFDMVDQNYQSTQNVKMLGWAAKEGYQFLLKNPVGPDGGLKGLKIRGNPAYEPIISALGGTTVTLASNEIYPSLQKNLIDGSAWVQSSMMSNRFDEVAGYMARPAFGAATLILVMNLDKFESLSPEDQQVMLDLGRDFEVLSRQISAEVSAHDIEGMLAHGVQYTEFGAEYANRINQIFNEGVWQRTIAQHGAAAQAIIDKIKETGMAQDERG